MFKSLKLSAWLLACVLASNAYAQSNHDQHATHGTTDPAVAELAQALDKMHAPMMAATNESDPDRAFIIGMIPHHQGAIDMAKVVLKYGKDPQVRKLAQDIIKAQEGEIAWMQQWLKDHPAKQ